MKTIHRVAVALSILAATTAGTALADPSVATLTIPSDLGSSPVSTSVSTWSWGASNGGPPPPGGGGTKTSIQDLSITRPVDGQSPLFFKVVATGDHIRTVALVDGPTTITLTDVMITGYTAGDSPPGNNNTRTESMTFSFEKAVYTVNGVTTCFDFSQSRSC